MMPDQERDKDGMFAAKGDTVRAVRTIRLTDATWHSLSDRADELDITKADYLEGLFSGSIDWESDDSELDKPDLDFDPEEVAEILTTAYHFKEKGKQHLRSAIKEVLELIGHPLEEED